MKEKVLKIVEKYLSKRENIYEFINYLDEIGFFTTAASTKYHSNYKGGLAEHSLKVVENIIKLYKTFKPEFPLEKAVFVALFHDVGKCGLKEKPMYVQKKEPINTEYYGLGFKFVWKKNLTMNHSVLSIYHLAKFFDLDEDEIHAILYHNGLYDNLGNELRNNEKPLMLLLHWADMWASRFDEGVKGC